MLAKSDDPLVPDAHSFPASPPEPLPKNDQPSSSVLTPALTINVTTPTPPPSTTEQQQQPESNPGNKAAVPTSHTELSNAINASNNVQPQQQASTIKPSPSQSTIATSSSSSSSSILKESSSLQSLLSSSSSCNIPLPSPAAITAACSTNTPNPLQTTNVYINGLPPNFKAEQLYALASQFGNVLSCRTFTRQLSDHPSGYGFVLFDTIESAQQCIDVLRSHHNLHPTFAKQAHKINRSPIMNVNVNSEQSDYVPELAKHQQRQQEQQEQQQLPQQSHHQPISSSNSNLTTLRVNQKVQSLGKPLGSGDLIMGGHDIYLGGLPTKIDMHALRALVSPYTFSDCRFFADTRVSPPCLVAYLQLESHTAALDLRARLHGRSIRGYSGRLEVTLGETYNSIDKPVSLNLTTQAGAFPNNTKFSSSSSSSSLKLPPSRSSACHPVGVGVHPGPSSTSNDFSFSATINGTTRGRTNQQQSVYPTPSSSHNDLGMGRLNGNGGGAVGGTGFPVSLNGLSTPVYALQGSGVDPGASKFQPQSHVTSLTSLFIPPQLQPLSNTINDLQMQLESLKPLLVGYGNGNSNKAYGEQAHTFNNISNVSYETANGGVTRSKSSSQGPCYSNTHTAKDGSGINGGATVFGPLRPLLHGYTDMDLFHSGAGHETASGDGASAGTAALSPSIVGTSTCADADAASTSAGSNASAVNLGSGLGAPFSGGDGSTK